MKPGLRHFFASMEAFLTGPAGVEGLHAAHPGWEAPRSRLALYGDFARGNTRDIVRKLYPLTSKLLGEAVFVPLVEAYRATRPARSYDINRLGEGFPAFVADEAVVRGLPAWVPELARFEWVDFAVFASEEEVPTRVERLTVNPTLQVLPMTFRVCVCVRAKAEAPPEPGEELALLWRHPEQLTTMYMSGSDRSLLVLKMAVEGLTPADVAAATGVAEQDIQDAVAFCAKDGLVLVP
jgi:hypothetical protein